MATPKVVEMDLAPTTVVGVSGVFTSAMAPDSDAHEVIPQLWQRLMDVTGEHFFTAQWSVGVMNDIGDGAKMNYLAAIRLADSGDQHEGLDVVNLSGGKYVACEHVGSLDSLASTTAWFYNDYLANSGIQVRNAYHLEIYDERFDPHASDSVMLICAPVL
jgi:predicted transcriptional regulator YdeE